MENTADFSMQPAEVIDASSQLDDLAARVDTLMAAEAPNLTVVAPGRDEVSQQVASTLNEVGDAFAKSTARGSTEIHEIAATLRAHTNNVVEADNDFAI
jgi:hypothetical protein